MKRFLTTTFLVAAVVAGNSFAMQELTVPKRPTTMPDMRQDMQMQSLRSMRGEFGGGGMPVMRDDVARIGAGGGARVKAPQPNVPPVKVDPVAKPLVQPVVQPSSRTKALGALDKRRAEEAAAKARAEAAKKTVIMDKGMTDRVGRDPEINGGPRTGGVKVDVMDKGMGDRVGRDPEVNGGSRGSGFLNDVVEKSGVKPKVEVMDKGMGDRVGRDPEINGGPRTGGVKVDVMDKGMTDRVGHDPDVRTLKPAEVPVSRVIGDGELSHVARPVPGAAVPAYQQDALRRAQEIQQQRRNAVRTQQRPTSRARGSSSRSYKAPQRY